MHFNQFYLNCLSHASYLIGSEGGAAVVDPQRDVDQYIQEAEAQGLKIKYVIETHLHADFVSGHRELAARTGAEIVYGARAGATFPHRAVTDGEDLALGSIRLRILETPGHTPESISILVADAADAAQPPKLLTGDTLFIGDVGRPDLVGSKGYTAEQMAAMLYDSLHEKILKLDDAVEVWPAHGAGSACGRNISKEAHSTIGKQRQFNYALQPMPKEEFVRLMTTDLPEAPAYFSKDAEINRGGAQALSEIPRPGALSPAETQALSGEGVIVLDVRPGAVFGAGHVPGAINIGLGGQFASWAGQLLRFDTPIIVVAEDDAQVDEAVTRLARVGIENVRGFLKGGIPAWIEANLPVATIAQISVEELRRLLDEPGDLQVIDVRQPGEYAQGHVPAAAHAPLAHVAELASQFDSSRQTAVICAGGYRSGAAASILSRAGFTRLFNVVGGTSAWVSAGFAVDRESANAA
jgi:glyoxylase-like metal-dependent hydrolase (beta-lactamase superfamily II)/rhodanese-related sulfurtransferase